MGIFKTTGNSAKQKKGANMEDISLKNSPDYVAVCKKGNELTGELDAVQGKILTLERGMDMTDAQRERLEALNLVGDSQELPPNREDLHHCTVKNEF